MVSSLDNELKTPMGNLFEGPEEFPEVAMTDALEFIDQQHSSIIAVGDVSVATLLEMGVARHRYYRRDDQETGIR